MTCYANLSEQLHKRCDPGCFVTELGSQRLVLTVPAPMPTANHVRATAPAKNIFNDCNISGCLPSAHSSNPDIRNRLVDRHR